jgi:hypothetical protein
VAGGQQQRWRLVGCGSYERAAARVLTVAAGGHVDGVCGVCV